MPIVLLLFFLADSLTELVDICITTTSKELEHVCLLAEVLARRKEMPLSFSD